MGSGRGGSQGAQSTIRGKNRRTKEAATTQRLPWRGGGQVSLVVLRIALLALASARTYLSGGEQRRVIVRAGAGAGGKRNASRAAQPAILAHFVMLHQCPTTACPTTTILLRRATVPPCAAADSRGGVSSG